MKTIKHLSWSIILLCGLIPALLYALVATSTGSQWVVQQAIKYSGQDVTVHQVSGSLLTGIVLSDVTFTGPAVKIDINQAEISWRPLDLFERRLSINAIELNGLQIQVSESSTQPKPLESMQSWQLPTIATPWPVIIDRLTIADAVITTATQSLLLNSISLSAFFQGSELSLNQVTIDHDQLNAELGMQMSLQQHYPFELGFVMTTTTELSHAQVPQGQLQGLLKGDSHQLNVTADIELSEYPTATTTLQATLTDLQGKPTWLADIKATQLPMTVLHLWLPHIPYDVQGFIQHATIDSTVTIDSNRIALTDTRISGLSSDAQGLIEITGDIAEYQQITSYPEQVQFNLAAIGNKLTIHSQSDPATTIHLNLGEISVTGSPALYSLALGSHWTLADTEDVSFGVAGIGTLNALALSEIAVSHATFDASLTAQMGWLETPWAAVNITEFVGKLPLFNQTYELLLSGGFGFINGAISANQVEATINGTHLTANGALNLDNTLAVTLSIPNLESWLASQYAAARIELKADISGDYLKQLDFSLHELKLTSELFGQWIAKPTSHFKLILDSFDINATPLCLNEQRERNPASVCLTPQLTQQTLLVNLDAKALPLRLLNRFRESDVAERIWGNVDATATISFDRANRTIRSMSGLFRSENTAITSLDDNLTFRLREWELRWNGNLNEIRGTLQAYLADNLGQVLGDVALTELTTNQSLTGSLDLSINDLTLLQWVLPDLRYVGASAIANIAVSGSLSHPTLSGAIELVADEIGFAQSGLLLTKVRLALEDKTDQTGILNLQGQARSGTGWIALQGEIDVPKRELSLDIDGDTFRAIELAMAQVDVSPDLHIKVANERIDITGTVTVPYAQINEPDLSASATVSSDVRLFMNGEAVTEEDDSLYPIYANIRVILSDNVAINAYGFKGNVRGSIGIIEEPNRALRATGSIQVGEGNYEIYGQELEIQRGVLIYNGGAIDNPGLDLRVVRTAASMTAANDQISVGAQVGGTLLNPDFRLFSSPTMQDADILSYLILGRPPGGGGSNNLQLQALLLIGSQGTDLIGKRLQETFGFDEFGIDSTADPLDTSFYIGKYLSPKLYVKYGVGLFENTNTFYIRYLLTDRLLIESTTSTEAQGGDILYTIEK
jgi:translocation and assembly module TamB